ncbi:hypothetical protein TrVE_jg1474 [Triparma verrucosa]|uniref:Uncharacterized protein n=1 Tax=Triparma verrucosa TaxID=1606542 RepID=A0A9W7EKW0_9STRA|nr:hypothetical protein TrVE_jg1474 [Triparma verrucosa]
MSTFFMYLDNLLDTNVCSTMFSSDTPPKQTPEDSSTATLDGSTSTLPSTDTLPEILPLASTSSSDQLSQVGDTMISYVAQLSEKVEDVIVSEDVLNTENSENVTSTTAPSVGERGEDIPSISHFNPSNPFNPSGSSDVNDLKFEEQSSVHSLDNRMSVEVENDKSPEELLAALSKVTDAKTLQSYTDQLSLVGDAISSYVAQLSDKVGGAMKDEEEGNLKRASPDQLSQVGSAIASYVAQLPEKSEDVMKDNENVEDVIADDFDKVSKVSGVDDVTAVSNNSYSEPSIKRIVTVDKVADVTEDSSSIQEVTAVKNSPFSEPSIERILKVSSPRISLKNSRAPLRRNNLDLTFLSKRSLTQTTSEKKAIAIAFKEKVRLGKDKKILLENEARERSKMEKGFRGKEGSRRSVPGRKGVLRNN